MASKVSGLIEQIQPGGSSGTKYAIASTAYGVCESTASDNPKIVEITGFKLIDGVTIHVKFTANNSASNPTLQIKYGTGTNDKTTNIPIVQYGDTAAGTAEETDGWYAGAILTLTYDGTSWVRDQGFNTNDIPNSILKWQTTTAASTELYDFGIYVNQNHAASSSMNGGNYFNILNVPYRKASGNTKADWGWQLGNTTANDGRLWYRTAGDNVWGDWQTIAHAKQSSADVGSTTQPVYMTSKGVITPISYTIEKSVPSNAVFTDTNKYHKTGSWGGTNNLTYTATAVNSADTLAFTLATASTSAYGVTKLSSATDSDSEVLAATPKAIKTLDTKMDGLLAAANAMTFKGTLGTGGTVTALPASHQAGDTYRVKTAGEWAGKYCEVGTLIICVTNGTAANDAHWTSVETNEDGAVIGPSSSTGNNIVTFSGNTGRIIQDSEKAFSTATPSSSSTDDQIPTAKAVWAVINALDGNLNSTTPGAGKTLTAFSQTNGKVSATFDDISITKSQVSDFAHAHGNLTNDGKITSTATIANGDKLVIVDSDASSKIIGATITFDGTTETKALTPKGTWVTFNNYSHPTSAGNKHIPSGGDTDQFLRYGGSSGTAIWSDLPVASTDTAGIIKIGTAATNAMAGNTVVNKVKQNNNTENKEFPILLKTSNNTTDETGEIKFVKNYDVAVNPSTGRLSATSFMVDSHVTLQWNSTDSSLDFIFA